MSTQNRSSGSGRNQKKSNPSSGSGGGGGGDSATQASIKKTDASKTEKEKVQPKPTAEQLRIAQITNSNASEDPQMREKVATLIEMTQRSEEEVCCALNECDNNMERAVVFLLETLPVGAFETSSKKKKNKAANAANDNAGGDGDWGDANANSDKREKSRNRNSNRGGRGNTDSRGWRGRESRENERNLRESRGDRGGDDRANENYRNGPRGGAGRGGGGRGGGYVGRGGRGGGRMGGRGSGGRGERGGGGYSSRQNPQDEHQEVELWDNTIAQNAEKQQLQTQDDAWGDWDNEEYVGSLKDSKVFTTSNLPNQTVASVVSGGTSDMTAPPGLEHHLGTSVLSSSATSQQQGSHLNALMGSAGGSLVDDNASGAVTGVGASSSISSTPMMQYSAAVSNTPLQQQQQPSAVTGSPAPATSLSATSLNATQYNSAADTFAHAASAAVNLVQQVQQQQQTPAKASATLSVEQSQYFNSLSSQNAANASNPQQQQQQMTSYVQNTSVQYPTSYANVFAAGDQTQLATGQQPQVRRARAKLPPPSKIPSTAVEMPGDTLNNIGYLDVQFGGLDFGTDDTFDAMPEKFNAAVTIDGQQQQQQQQQQQLVQAQQDVNDYQNKSNVQQQQQSALTADSLSSGYSQRSGTQQQVVSSGGGGAGVTPTMATASNALEQLTKSDPYNQANASSSSGYQSSYQTSAPANKVPNSYQQSGASQVYNSSSYANVQSSVANTYQQQTYGAYQPNSVSSYQPQQQQQTVSGQNAASTVAGNNMSGNSGSTQNIPVGGGNSNGSNSAASSNAGYLSSAYPTNQSAYQSSQNVYGSTGISNNTGFAGSTNSSSSQYSNFSTSAKLKDTSSTSSTSHYDSSSASNVASSASGTVVSSVASTTNTAPATNTNNGNANSGVGAVAVASSTSVSSNNGNSVAGSSSSSVGVGVGVGANNSGSTASSVVAAAASVSSTSNKNSAGAGGMVPNIQMVSQYIQTGMPYYQPPVYSYEDIQMMQQRVPHVQGYYDLNYTPTSLGTGRDNLGSVAYSTMTDGRFTRTDNNSSPVSNVSSTMSQQAGSSAPMLNVPYAYFYGGNVMPGSFQYGTPAIYPQIPAANTASGGQFPKPSYNAGYGSTSYDTLSQASQDYSKGGYPSSVNQQTKSQNVSNPPQAGTGSDMSSSMYGKGHVALNKVNSYEKQNFHSGTPPPFNMPNTQTAGGTSAQPYSMYLPMPAAGHHNMIHQPIHQMDGRIHNSSRRDSNSTGQRQQNSSQSKSANKQGYSPSYWTGQN